MIKMLKERLKLIKWELIKRSKVMWFSRRLVIMILKIILWRRKSLWILNLLLWLIKLWIIVLIWWMKKVQKRVQKFFERCKLVTLKEQNYHCCNHILQNHQYFKKIKLINNLQQYLIITGILMSYLLNLYRI